MLITPLLSFPVQKRIENCCEEENLDSSECCDLLTPWRWQSCQASLYTSSIDSPATSKSTSSFIGRAVHWKDTLFFAVKQISRENWRLKKPKPRAPCTPEYTHRSAPGSRVNDRAGRTFSAGASAALRVGKNCEITIFHFLTVCQQEKTSRNS